MPRRLSRKQRADRADIDAAVHWLVEAKTVRPDESFEESRARELGALLRMHLRLDALKARNTKRCAS